MSEPTYPTRSREHIAHDVKAEIAEFIAERTAELVASGIDAKAAATQARAEFGDLAKTEQYCTEQDVVVDRQNRLRIWITEFVGDMRIAARSLSRTPSVAAVVLATFALGIGATTAVFSAVHALLFRPLPYANAEALYEMPSLHNGVREVGAEFSAVMLRESQQLSSFSAVVGAARFGVVLVAAGNPEFVTASRMGANGFEVLGARASMGRTFVTGDDSTGATPVVVLSDGLWRRRFGADSAIVGKRIDLSGNLVEVVGVMPRAFRFPTMEDTEMWLPLDMRPFMADVNRSKKFRFIHAFGRTAPGVSEAVANADLQRMMQRLAKDDPESFGTLGARATGIREAVVGNVKARITVVMGASLLVLLIGCANIAGVLLSRAIARQHELSVRAALGASRQRLVRQFLAEGAVLTIGGAALGIAVAAAGITALKAVALGTLPPGTDFSLEPRVLAFALVVAAVSGLLFSVAPAIAATAFPGMGLRQVSTRTTAGRARSKLRSGLVAAQLGVSVVLLVAAGLFVRSLHNIASLDLGYRTEGVLSFGVGLPRGRYADDAAEDRFWTALYAELHAIPGVTYAGGAGSIPLRGSSSASIVIEGQPIPEGPRPDLKYAVASDEYFSALGIPLVRGRFFGAADTDSVPPVVLISASAAKRFWGSEDPIGKRARFGPNPTEPWSTIVGVVGDVRLGAAGELEPTVYATQRQDHWRGGTVVVRGSGDASSLIASAREAVKHVDAALPITNVLTLDDFHAQVLGDRRMQMQLVLTFALIALLVSAIGVYGVCAYAVEARRREFGIRLALGASRLSVLGSAIRDGANSAIIGAAVGLPIALFVASRMKTLLYGVQPFDPLTVIGVFVALMAAALAATIVPARRATLVDPATTMRED